MAVIFTKHRGESGLAELLRQHEGHLEELGRRWYAGDAAVVDEVLQLYCIEEEARERVVKEQGA